VIFLREVDFHVQWKGAFRDVGAVPRGDNLPTWALASFTPSEIDSGGLSVYGIDDFDEHREVAAAISFQRSGNKAIVFIGADEAALSAAGANITKTPGTLSHPRINGRHYEIKISTLSELVAVTETFLTGSYYIVESKVFGARLIDSARQDQIDFPLAASRKQIPAIREKSMAMIAERVVNVRGIPNP
jgi:hypothetical protein